MFKLIRLLVALPTIAKEITLIRQLYELDLGSRNPPVYRITETPSPKDTEVSYTDDFKPKKSALDRIKEVLNGDDDEDELI